MMKPYCVYRLRSKQGMGITMYPFEIVDDSDPVDPLIALGSFYENAVPASSIHFHIPDYDLTYLGRTDGVGPQGEWTRALLEVAGSSGYMLAGRFVSYDQHGLPWLCLDLDDCEGRTTTLAIPFDEDGDNMDEVGAEALLKARDRLAREAHGHDG